MEEPNAPKVFSYRRTCCRKFSNFNDFWNKLVGPAIELVTVATLTWWMKQHVVVRLICTAVLLIDRVYNEWRGSSAENGNGGRFWEASARRDRLESAYPRDCSYMEAANKKEEELDQLADWGQRILFLASSFIYNLARVCIVDPSSVSWPCKKMLLFLVYLISTSIGAYLNVSPWISIVLWQCSRKRLRRLGRKFRCPWCTLNRFQSVPHLVFFLKRTHCIEYSKNKTNVHIKGVWCYEWMI